MLELLRRYTFWILDFLKGGNFKKNYRDIKLINENFSSVEAQSKRNLYLKNVLNHAIETTEFYSHLPVNTLLDEFPVIDKNVIRDNFGQFQSELFKDKTNYKVSTSGSTGTPFTTYLNKNKKTRNSADTIYFAEKSGFKLGNQLIYIRLWDEQHRKNPLSSWIQNIVSHDVSNLSDNDIKGLLENLQRSNSKKGFLAYASAYDAICQYLDKHNSEPINCNVKSIIAISESLSDYAKESMEKYFGCSVVSRYSASETGILAQQRINSDNFDINWASYVIEILNIDTDTPVKLGETGRIVITDLFNYAVPMIRYDTGDLGVMAIVDGVDAPVLTKVEGRKMDMLSNTKGELITSHIVHQICLFEGIIQYQLIQEDEKNYLFKINATSNFNQEQKIIDTYKKYFGEDAIIKIEYVNDIPLLSSGKRKKVINLYNKG